MDTGYRILKVGKTLKNIKKILMNLRLQAKVWLSE